MLLRDDYLLPWLPTRKTKIRTTANSPNCHPNLSSERWAHSPKTNTHFIHYFFPCSFSLNSGDVITHAVNTANPIANTNIILLQFLFLIFVLTHQSKDVFLLLILQRNRHSGQPYSPQLQKYVNTQLLSHQWS